MRLTPQSACVLAFVLTMVVTGAPSPAADTGGVAKATRLLGAWHCAGSVVGSTSDQAYRRTENGSLDLAFSVHTAAGVVGNVHETLTYDRTGGFWSLAAGKNRFFDSERLAARDWAGRDWSFSGTEIARGNAHPVRIVYSSLAPDSFARRHQLRSDGRWITNGTFLCRRPPQAIAARDASPTHPSGTGTTTHEVVHVSAPPPAVANVDATSAATPNPEASRRSAARVPARLALGMTPRPREAADRVDRAYALTHDVWTCKTFGGVDATHTYIREADGTIRLHNVLVIAKRAYAIDEVYRFDPRTNAWTTTTSGEAYVGIADRWLTDTWVFTGTMPDGGRRVPVEMVYSKLGDRAFRRAFIRLQPGKRTTFAAETCRPRR